MNLTINLGFYNYSLKEVTRVPFWFTTGRVIYLNEQQPEVTVDISQLSDSQLLEIRAGLVRRQIQVNDTQILDKEIAVRKSQKIVPLKDKLVSQPTTISPQQIKELLKSNAQTAIVKISALDLTDVQLVLDAERVGKKRSLVIAHCETLLATEEVISSEDDIVEPIIETIDAQIKIEDNTISTL